MPQESLLEIRHLSIEIVTRSGIGRPVNDVSYTVASGETLGIVGESGSGKSLHLLAMLGLLPGAARVVQGEVIFQGRDLLRLPRAGLRDVLGRSIGMIFQDPMMSLNPVMPIGRQVGEVLVHNRGMGRAQKRARVLELLDLVGIAEPHRRVAQFPHQLSGGMRQRVMIAMALACEPALLIADEATTALDVTVQAQVLDLIRDLKRRLSMAVIWVTHDMGVVAGLADTVQVMYAGQIMERGPARAVFHDPRNAYTWSLLRSLPRPDQGNARPLYQIPGQPPDPFDLPAGDPFASRNPFATPRCFTERPPLREVPGAPGHLVAAWYDLPTVLAQHRPDAVA
jgi:peptide/nickel transport system ATP-binding protein/oligopeptide transport system ATP-binding protein